MKVQRLNMGVQFLSDRDKNTVAHLCHQKHPKFNAADHQKIQCDSKKGQKAKAFEIF